LRTAPTTELWNSATEHWQPITTKRRLGTEHTNKARNKCSSKSDRDSLTQWPEDGSNEKLHAVTGLVWCAVGLTRLENCGTYSLGPAVRFPNKTTEWNEVSLPNPGTITIRLARTLTPSRFKSIEMANYERIFLSLNGWLNYNKNSTNLVLVVGLGWLPGTTTESDDMNG